MNLEAFYWNMKKFPFGICFYRSVAAEGAHQEEYAFVDANEAFFSCTGYDRSFFESRNGALSQMLDRNDREKATEWMKMAQGQPGTFYGGIIEVLQSDKSGKYLEWSVCAGDDGKVVFVCADVDSLMQSNQELSGKLTKERLERQGIREMLRELPFGMAVLKNAGRFPVAIANGVFLQLLGRTAEQTACGKVYMADYVQEEDWPAFRETLEICFRHEKRQELELRIKTEEGGYRWQLFQCQPYYGEKDLPNYLIASWDIHDRKLLEDELKLLDTQYRLLEEVTDEFSFEYDVVQRRFRIPNRYRKIGKVKNAQQNYMSWEQNLNDIYEEDRESYQEALVEAAKQEMAGTIDYRLNVSSEGEESVYNWYRTVYRSISRDSKIVRIIGRSYDISSDRKIQEKLSEEMRLDPLTRLLNKVATGEEVKKFISEKPGGTHVMFIIDIDNFKSVNDAFGHTVGDTVISDIAQLIQENFRASDIVGRVGGDEFLVFMKNTTMEVVVEKAKKLCSGCGKQLIGDEAVVNVTLSIGIAIYGVDGDDYNSLFQMADRAMYRIKKNGKNSFSFVQKENASLYGSDRKETGEGDIEKRHEIDKDFMNVAFSLLTHAKDMNGSLNVLLERIGKKYQLDMLSVFEYGKDKRDMRLTNYWSNFGQVYEKTILPRKLDVFENASIGEFVMVTENEPGEPAFLYENWNTGEHRICYLAGIKFEYGNKHTGCFYLGTRRKERIFYETEKMTHCELSRVVAAFVTLRNKLNDDQKEIQDLQSRDQLTGLYNLETFRNKTEELLSWEAKMESPQYQYAMVHVDINNFSYINENYGQVVGDSILKEFGDLVRQFEQVVFACRMYSDYFALLIKGESQAEIQKKIVWAKRYYEILTKKQYPNASMRLAIGVYYIENLKESFTSILESSNLARKQAKKQNSMQCCVYHAELRAERDAEIRVTGRFYNALKKGEFQLYLQPKFLLKERSVYGAEALTRWRTADGEIVFPKRFVPALENIGYIVDLDFYILEQLLKLMQKWKAEGKPLFIISANFSRKHFENGGEEFIKRLQSVVERHEIAPKYIEIEITESVIVENLQKLRPYLLRLKELGYRIAIDDFGTGYSSLSVLLEIPVDAIKIDKGFTDKINLSEQRYFISCMGEFIHAANEEVIFEGVETEEQAEFLSGCGFKYGQGYLIDQPLPVEEFEQKYV